RIDELCVGVELEDGVRVVVRVAGERRAVGRHNQQVAGRVDGRSVRVPDAAATLCRRAVEDDAVAAVEWHADDASLVVATVAGERSERYPDLAAGDRQRTSLLHVSRGDAGQVDALVPGDGAGLQVQPVHDVTHRTAQLGGHVHPVGTRVVGRRTGDAERI